MNLTNHCKERYCERVLEIPKDEIKMYIAQNDARITEDINTLFEHAKFIWRGQINDNITRNFYIKDFIIIVANVTNDAIFTLYKVDFGFPEESNKFVAKDLVANIDELNAKFAECVENNRLEVDKKMVEKENLTKDIQSLEDTIKLLKQKRDFVDLEMKQINAEPFIYQKEIDRHAVNLCNSLGYKLDTIQAQKK